MEIRKLPIGIQSFEDLRNNQYLYVDKTAYIWKMVNTGKTYFLSRPRRFGKSMLTSAIRAYFEGKKDLFHGLAIEKYENEKGSDAWISYPVLYFSLASGEYRTENGLREALEMILNKYERIYGVHAEKLNLSNRFRMDIENIYQTTGKQVVVLVDEYDKPLLDNMEINEKQEERNRQLYSDFFSALKDEDEFVKFVFITGVTKFAKVSVFSGMNQPRDVSMSDEYAGICGITEKELNDLFMPEIKAMAEAQKMSVEECVRSLAYMYDGYHFSKNSEGVYNPFSLFNAFEDKNFGSYWFDTGTPTFLIHKLKNSDFSPEDFSEGVEIGETQLPDYRPDNTNPIPLFFQTGYLTICGYRKRIQPGNGVYMMKFPNKEVRTGFLDMLAPYVLGSRNTDDKRPYEKMAQDIEKGDIDSFMSRLKALFALISYPDNHEESYEWERRNQIFMLFVLLGENVHAEVHSSYGRADCIVETEKYVYVFEFKLDQSADEAMKQIEEKGYALPYQADERTVYQIGVKFSSEKRTIEEWKCIPA